LRNVALWLSGCWIGESLKRALPVLRVGKSSLANAVQQDVSLRLNPTAAKTPDVGLAARRYRV
jgi:hypothetical protein